LNEKIDFVANTLRPMDLLACPNASNVYTPTFKDPIISLSLRTGSEAVGGEGRDSIRGCELDDNPN